MKKLLTEWRKYLKEEDDWAAEFGGFSDEERGPEIQRSPHLDDLGGLDRGDTFTIGNRKPVYRVIGALTDKGIAKGQPTKLVVVDGSGERKTYEVRSPRTGEEGEVGAFGKDENNEYEILIGKTGFVMNITKPAGTNK